MDSLIRYGFTIDEIKNMMENNEAIEETEEKDIQKIIKILEEIKCTKKIIKNIFYSNPYCLLKTPEEIKCILKLLQDNNFTHLEILLDTNPYLLNIGEKEIKKIIKQKEKEGMTEEQIKDYFYYCSDEIF